MKALYISIPFGILVALVLFANNMRDIDYDSRHNVKTLGIILGIRKSYGSSANDITAATADIYKQAATERLGAYRRSHRDKEIKPKALSFI